MELSRETAGFHAADSPWAAFQPYFGSARGEAGTRRDPRRRVLFREAGYPERLQLQLQRPSEGSPNRCAVSEQKPAEARRDTPRDYCKT